MLSIWERNSFLNYHYIIIGGGIVGLTTAYYLKMKSRQSSVLVLERGLLPSGASTKNAGFACMGSLTEILDDLKVHSEQEVTELFLQRKNGLVRLESLLGAAKMGYRREGSYELIGDGEISDLNQLEYCNHLLFDSLGKNAFQLCNEKIEEFGFEKGRVRALVENTCEGEIDTGLMMKNLISLVQESGVEIKTGCSVRSFEDRGSGVEVNCTEPVSLQNLSFQAGKLLICNNAFAGQFIPGADIKPGRGQVLITYPVEGLKFKGIFHFGKGFFYFREYKGRVLFGGGRNLDLETETTTELLLNERIQLDLTEKLRHTILPDQAFAIDMRWSGIMAFGKTKRPIIERLSDNVFVGVRMGGMGVAIGSEVGFTLSEMAVQ